MLLGTSLPAGKQCVGCGETKTLDKFYRDIRRSDGRVSQCADCKCAAIRKYRIEHPDAARSSARKSRRKTYLTTGRARKLLKNYGLTVERYSAIAEAQNHRCAICGDAPSGRANNGEAHAFLAVDHDHVSGRVRGLLCVNCNKAIGLLRDDPAILFAALKYLDKSEGA